MDNAKIAADLVSAANAVTAFAILQSIAFSYGLLKRELRVRLDGSRKYIATFVGALWVAVYVFVVWWCSMTAIKVSPPINAEFLHVVHQLAWGRCLAVAAFGLVSLWLIFSYHNKRLWNDTVVHAAQPGAPADAPLVARR